MSATLKHSSAALSRAIARLQGRLRDCGAHNPAGNGTVMEVSAAEARAILEQIPYLSGRAVSMPVISYSGRPDMAPRSISLGDAGALAGMPAICYLRGANGSWTLVIQRGPATIVTLVTGVVL